MANATNANSIVLNQVHKTTKCNHHGLYLKESSLVTMSQQETISQRKPWVLVSSLRENTDESDFEKIRIGVSDLIDSWQSQGRTIWSGALNDNKTGIAIFEATNEEANQLYDKYANICQNTLDYYLYQWDAMPILSILDK